MVIYDPPQPAKASNEFYANLIELHLFICFDLHSHVAWDVRPTFGKRDAFEDGNVEDFAFGLPAEDIEGNATQGASRVDEGRDVGQDRGSARAS